MHHNIKFSKNRLSQLSYLLINIAIVLYLSVAQAGTITLNGQENIAFTVTNLSNAAGFGIHFSTTAYTDGWGGTHAECHLTSGSVSEPDNNVYIWCSDGHTGRQTYHNVFIFQ
jgi:hypothetical protein